MPQFWLLSNFFHWRSKIRILHPKCRLLNSIVLFIWLLNKSMFVTYHIPIGVVGLTSFLHVHIASAVVRALITKISPINPCLSIIIMTHKSFSLQYFRTHVVCFLCAVENQWLARNYFSQSKGFAKWSKIVRDSVWFIPTVHSRTETFPAVSHIKIETLNYTKSITKQTLEMSSIVCQRWSTSVLCMQSVHDSLQVHIHISITVSKYGDTFFKGGLCASNNTWNVLAH